MVVLGIILFGLAAFVALINLTMMPKPRLGPLQRVEAEKLAVLIPARNEEANLTRLLPTLLAQTSNVWVYNDESSDATAEVVRNSGANLLDASRTLPEGWTGKNWACHNLANHVLGLEPAPEVLLFLDADTFPKENFLSSVLEVFSARPDCGVLTGFPHIRHGQFPEPVALGWVAWILLATAPFGLVSRSKKGHTRFTNGQLHAWRAEVYRSLQPNEAVRGQILEDVKMGRLCAAKGVAVEVGNFSEVFGVKMYDTFKEAVDGMSKNSYEITGSTVGTVALAALFLLYGFGWLAMGGFWWLGLGLLFLSSLAVCLTCRAALWFAPLLPLSLLTGSFTLLRSLVWHRKGVVAWKGRTYAGHKPSK